MEKTVCDSEPAGLMESNASCKACLNNQNCDCGSCEPHQKLDSRSCEPQKNLFSKVYKPHENLDRKMCDPRGNLDSKSFQPHQNLDSKSFQPHQNLDSKSFQPHQNLDSKSFQPHQYLGSKSFQSHQNLDDNELCEPHQILGSKSCVPHQNLGSKSCVPHQNLDNELCEPHQNLDNELCEPHQNLDNELCEPHQNLGSKSCEPHQNLDNELCKPHQNLDNELCEPHQNLDSKSCEPNENSDSKSCVPHQTLDSTLCEPNQNSGTNPYEYNHNPLYSNPSQLHRSPGSSPCPVNQNPESSACGPSRTQGCCKHGQCPECGSSNMGAQLSPHHSSWEDQVAKEVIQRWDREQSEYKEKLIVADTPEIISWLSENSDNDDAKEFYIGGADISFIKDNNVDACSCLTVVRTSDLQVVYQRIEMIQLTQPYVPGYLAFREVQPLVDLYNQLRVAAPQYLPDVIMVDGNGVLHPRGFGLACHLGVVLGVPTLGVAKTLITAQGIHDDQDHKLKKQTLKQAGDFFDLVSDFGSILGRCVRTCNKAPNPIYISVGHRITLESATQICLRVSKYRIPEPVRKADIDSREFLRQNKVEPYEFIKESPDQFNHPNK